MRRNWLPLQLAPLLAQVVPEVEERDEVAVLVGEAGVLLAGLLLLLGRPFARVGDADSAAAMTRTSRTQPSCSACRIMRARRGSTGNCARRRPTSVIVRVLVEGAEFLQQRDAVADAAPVGRVEEREVLDVAEAAAPPSAGSPRRGWSAGSRAR